MRPLVLVTFLLATAAVPAQVVDPALEVMATADQADVPGDGNATINGWEHRRPARAARSGQSPTRPKR